MDLFGIFLEYPWEWGSPSLPPQHGGLLLFRVSLNTPSRLIHGADWIQLTYLNIPPSCSAFLPCSSWLAGPVLPNTGLPSACLPLPLTFLYASSLLKCQRQPQRHVCLKLLPPTPTSPWTEMLLRNVLLSKLYLLVSNVGATSWWEGCQRFVAAASAGPVVIPLSTAGAPNEQPQVGPLWHVDYLELKTIKAPKTQEEMLTFPPHCLK